MFGKPATRTTWVADTREKEGSTGALTFVTVRNEDTQVGRVCIVDENDIVYRTPGSQDSGHGVIVDAWSGAGFDLVA